MKTLLVGSKVGSWVKSDCECGAEYYVTRCDPKVVEEKDLLCSDCRDVQKVDNKLFKLECDKDLLQREIVELKKTLGGMIDVAEELNYRIREGRTSEGFHGVIDNAKKYTEDYYKGEIVEGGYPEPMDIGGSKVHGRLV